jgi:hypothetical protein
MDSADWYEMFERRISFADVMTRKVRRAAQRGMAFVRVRNL